MFHVIVFVVFVGLVLIMLLVVVVVVLLVVVVVFFGIVLGLLCSDCFWWFSYFLEY